uniref:Peptidase S1 domain-containing protein n=1 Tax=Anopheles quadriannulatus TaxID=34691 RepID=A0A182WVA5_ANOQN
MHQRLIVIASALLLIADLVFSENAFIDSAPEGYYDRKSLADCPSRFYSEDVSSALGFFIFGGRRAFLKEFPHMAAIGWTDKTVSPPVVQYKCGGSLIAAKYVLTAAHCKVDDEKIPPDTVRLGDTNLATTEDDETAQQFKIVSFTVHEKFKKNRKYYDIALIELDREAKFNTAVCPICLWPLDNIHEYSSSLRAIGFGFTTYTSGMSPTLQKVSLNYYDSDSCNNELPKDARLRYGLTSDQFCTKTPHKDACLGDSGGPLQIDLSDVTRTIPYLTGVVSFGTGCWDGSMGVYTKVASYINWIRERVNVTVDPIECARNTECLAARSFSDSRLIRIPLKQVNLRKADNSSFHQCSGALIDYRHVVTSATCAIRNNQQPAFIEANKEMVEIVDIDVHPKFVAGKNYHNLAMLTLGKFYNPNKIYQIIAPGCIWKEERITDPIVFFSGYGPEVKNEPEDVAKNVSLKVLVALVTENGRCEASDAWKVNSTLWSGFNSDFLCTFNPIDLVPGICKLEPGGAVSNFRRDNIVPYVYAVNTMDEGECGGTQNLFVATRLAPFYDWIESIILRHLPENDPILTSIRFGGDESDTPSVDTSTSNEIDQIVHQNRIVPAILSDVIANHIKPYGDDLMKSRPQTTKVNIYHQSLNNVPETYEVYGPHTPHSQMLVHPFQTSPKTKQSVLVPPVQNTIHNNDVHIELIPSVELPPTHIIQGQGHPQVVHSRPSATYSPYTRPNHFQSVVPYGQSMSGQRVDYQGPNSPHPAVDHNHLVSIIRSIELYENGHCTLPTGAPGRCLHYTRCPSMYWNRQNVDVFLRLNLIPLCNRAQETVCCQV